MGCNPSKNKTEAVEEVEQWAERVPRDMSPPPGLGEIKIDRNDEPTNGGDAKEKKEKKKGKKVKKIKLTEGIVQDYINIEKSINRLERKNVLKKYEAKTIIADDIKKTVDQLEATFKELKKQTEKEKADVDNIEQPSVKSFLKTQGTFEARLGKEKKEYQDAMKKMEIADKELRTARQQHQRATKIQEIYKQQNDNLNALYEKQDKMLASIFGHEYASEKENQLESEVDELIEWQQRVSLAMFKWTNGRVLLVHANTQMAFGTTRWQEVKDIEASNSRMRYFAAAEARNNFIAAGQNVQSCRVYLGKVQFPYATEEEMSLMENTVNTAFKDVQNDDSLKSALKVFQDTHKKISSLIQWFDKVINETIRKDLDKANDSVIKTQISLREERLSLMRKKCKEELGHDMKFEYDHVDDDELEKELLALEAEALKDAEEMPSGDLKGILGLSNPDGRDSDTSKLAPIPSKDALFGDVKQKLDEYDSTRKTFEKRNTMQREKQAMALQEKLRQRAQNTTNSDSSEKPAEKEKKKKKKHKKQAVAPINEEV